MPDPNDDIEIVVENEATTNKEADVVVEAAEAPSKKVISAEDGISDLKRRLEEAELRQADAEKRARDAVQQARQFEERAESSDLHLINSAIHSVRRENDILKANLRSYMANGDYDRAAEVQEALSVNAAKILQLENGKSAMESTPKQSSVAQPRATDPVEALASQLSPRSAAWVRRNPQCVTDPRLYQKMVAAHNLAVADGYEADSDDYFSFVEDTLKLNRNDAAQNTNSALSAAAAPTQRRSAPPAAPVSRSGTASGVRPNVVRLTAEEREMAKMMDMTEAQYAKNKLALQRDGKLN